MLHIPHITVCCTSHFPIWKHNHPQRAPMVWIIFLSQLGPRHLHLPFFSFEALNLSSSASAQQSCAAACALAGIDKHLGFHIQLHPDNPLANRSICRRLQKQGTTLKWRWLRHGKAFANRCWYPNVHVSRGNCATSHTHTFSCRQKQFQRLQEQVALWSQLWCKTADNLLMATLKQNVGFSLKTHDTLFRILHLFIYRAWEPTGKESM